MLTKIGLWRLKTEVRERSSKISQNVRDILNFSSSKKAVRYEKRKFQIAKETAKFKQLEEEDMTLLTDSDSADLLLYSQDVNESINSSLKGTDNNRN